MAEPVLAQFGRVDDRALWRPSAQMRWAREMAVIFLRRESSIDAPGRPPPCLRSLPIYVVHQRLGRTHPHQPYWPWSHLLHRSHDRWHVVVWCPFQTPVSIALRGSWKKVRPEIISLNIHPTRMLSRTRQMWNWGVRSLLHRQALPTVIPFENIEVHRSEPWMTPKDLATIRRTNTNDVQCVSWILRNITDPEALDAAIRLAGVVRWFDNGTNIDLPYGLVVSTFEACFDSTRKLYPGSRDRAYYSGRAMAWIRILAMCKSEEFASTFPPPAPIYTTPVPDPDLEHLLDAIYGNWDPSSYIECLLDIDPGHTHLHSQWISNLFLHHSWANRTKLDYKDLLDCLSRRREIETTIPLPLNTAVNRLLAWCTFLGSPVEEAVLMVQDKPYDIFRFCP